MIALESSIRERAAIESRKRIEQTFHDLYREISREFPVYIHFEGLVCLASSRANPGAQPSTIGEIFNLLRDEIIENARSWAEERALIKVVNMAFKDEPRGKTIDVTVLSDGGRNGEA